MAFTKLILIYLPLTPRINYVYKSLLWKNVNSSFVLNHVHFSFRAKTHCDIIHLPAESCTFIMDVSGHGEKFKKSTLPVGSESFSSQFDFCSSIPRTDFDLLDRDLQFKNIHRINL